MYMKQEVPPKQKSMLHVYMICARFVYSSTLPLQQHYRRKHIIHEYRYCCIFIDSWISAFTPPPSLISSWCCIYCCLMICCTYTKYIRTKYYEVHHTYIWYNINTWYICTYRLNTAVLLEALYTTHQSLEAPSTDPRTREFWNFYFLHTFTPVEPISITRRKFQSSSRSEPPPRPSAPLRRYFTSLALGSLLESQIEKFVYIILLYINSIHMYIRVLYHMILSTSKDTYNITQQYSEWTTLSFITAAVQLSAAVWWCDL